MLSPAPHGGAGLKPCLLIPIYQHGSTIRGVIRSLAELSLHCFIVNDGSDAATCAVLEAIEEEFDWVEVEHHATNRGKGVALRRGYRLAASRGFTHVVQLDADAQHEAADVNLDTRVRYYPGGISHFDVLWDDLRLAWLYARLALGTLTRARGLLGRHMGQLR